MSGRNQKGGSRRSRADALASKRAQRATQRLRARTRHRSTVKGHRREGMGGASAGAERRRQLRRRHVACQETAESSHKGSGGWTPPSPAGLEGTEIRRPVSEGGARSQLRLPSWANTAWARRLTTCAELGVCASDCAAPPRGTRRRLRSKSARQGETAPQDIDPLETAASYGDASRRHGRNCYAVRCWKPPQALFACCKGGLQTAPK